MGSLCFYGKMVKIKGCKVKAHCTANASTLHQKISLWLGLILRQVVHQR